MINRSESEGGYHAKRCDLALTITQKYIHRPDSELQDQMSKGIGKLSGWPSRTVTALFPNISGLDCHKRCSEGYSAVGMHCETK